MQESLDQRRSVSAYLNFFAEEIGLKTLAKSNKDVFIIILLRMLRLTGFGATSLILVLYLKQIGFKEQFIGMFMTVTFIGDLVTSFLLAIAADIIGRKNVLIFSSIAMTLTGICFVLFENPFLLTAIAALGILTPYGGEVGPFRSIEQSSLASLAPPEQRSDIYAWYTFLGTFCAAVGSIVCGTLVDYMNTHLDYSLAASYKIAFLGYSVLSFLTIILSYFISIRVEWTSDEQAKKDQSSNQAGTGQDETSQLLGPESSPQPQDQQGDREQDQTKPKESTFKFLPTLNKSILVIVIKLSLLFALDSFASSLISTSWISYYIKEKFDASASYLGSVFFITGIISSFTSLLSTSLTKRLGPVVTMVVTHLPSSILLALVPFPTSLKFTMAILILRASTQSMDVAPKHVFLATLVPSSDRTAVFGWVNVVKTLAQVIGPTITGFFTVYNIQWICFVIAGSLKVTYDVGILATFLSYNRHTNH
ncbi:DEHA2C17600p [Debaryomyces hansenii CBS767]|jgi:MFS family permease|uniref:DEHA2C17600p n=1 Tax=Debaryomyces hansenii (strain ATCC 36239 / CBS 767 / BCRC 21394 / JCM 1990 / NBRC 0083 / IGC 2968) TaxID=284592 RepID=Q6BTL2_DEBHA|nr:DEHA2C17600p [Debaryomyces hansenii CBS767]CAG86539.1 DEHA2C17600p [Debaryomyces hansenii CBS767]|eukprot:XP_458457.1 DEHA2C17600p [Debaryomyces hansenii CBS767]